MYSLEEFRVDLINDIQAKATAEIRYPYSVFLEKVRDVLVDVNKVSDITEYFYEREHGDKTYKSMKVFGGNVDPLDSTVDLFYVDYNNGPIETINREKLVSFANYLINFFVNVVNGFFRDNKLNGQPVYQLSVDILKSLDTCCKIKPFIISTNSISERISEFHIDPIKVNGRTISIEPEFIDISYLYQQDLHASSDQSVDIDFSKYGIDGIQCIKPDLGIDDYDAYMAVIRGDVLGDIFRDFGGTILQKNVRSFLSTRGGVNKGIRATIRDNPTKFFTYNNGIACTADSVVTENIHGIPVITQIKNFQIINGGQTTASLRNTYLVEKDVHLEKVFVPMKLTVISYKVSEDDKSEMVRLISQYANTQNKVKNTDFASNIGFYVRFKEIANNLYAPKINSDQTFQTRWYFERARGEYEREQMEMTAGAKKIFKAKNPKSQVITKADIAKAYNSVNLQPYNVAWGAEVNADEFETTIVALWEKDKSQFTEEFVKKTIAEHILFQKTRELISGTEWYKLHSGILAQLAPYTISKICYEVSKIADKEIDFDGIWQRQGLTSAEEKQILDASKFVYETLSDPAREKDNIAEWCKLEKCWDHLKACDFKLNDDFVAGLGSVTEEKIKAISAAKVQKVADQIDMAMKIYNLGTAYWDQVINEGLTHSTLSDRELSFLRCARTSTIKGNLVSNAQAKIIMDIQKKLELAGYKVAMPK